MRNVSAKIDSLRTASAEAILSTAPETIDAIREGHVPKGDPLPIARVAGIQAAKNTPQLIPYCHTVPLDHVSVDFELGESQVRIVATATAVYRTGVEMEALSAASVAALNLYDMLKMIDETMEIRSIRLLEKTGGKSDLEARKGRLPRAAILVCSDRAASGARPDGSGTLLKEGLEAHGAQVVAYEIVRDDLEAIRAQVTRFADDLGADIILATGGTGIGPRDVTPEAIEPLLERRLPGIEAHLASYGQRRTPRAMLSRSLAGLRGCSLVIALPGSPSAARDALAALFPYVFHTMDVIVGGGHAD